MRNATTGQYTCDVRNVLTEDLRFIDGTTVRMSYEDGQYTGVTVYVPNRLGKEYKASRGAINYVAKHTANVLRDSDLTKLHEKLRDRVAAGEQPEAYRLFVIEQAANAARNAELAEQYAGTRTATYDGALVQVIEETATTLTVRFANGELVTMRTDLAGCTRPLVINN